MWIIREKTNGWGWWTGRKFTKDRLKAKRYTYDEALRILADRQGRGLSYEMELA